MLCGLLHSLAEILITRDVVAIEGAPGPLPTDRHRHAFTDAGLGPCFAHQSGVGRERSSSIGFHR
jgi:hypothetical protein